MVCMGRGPVIHTHICSQAKVVLQSLEEPCGMAWERFNNSYGIAKLFGDLGNSRVEACSAGFYTIYLNLN